MSSCYIEGVIIRFCITGSSVFRKGFTEFWLFDTKISKFY